MKKLYLLKALVDLFWFFSVIAIIALLIFIPFFLFNDESLDIPIKIGGEKIVLIDLSTKLMFLGYVISYSFFVYGVFLFRKVLNHFSKREIFHEAVISLLNKIGVFFLTASLIDVVLGFVMQLYPNREAELRIISGFESFLFTASLGLFFMVLSEVFSMGKNIKEENELTI